MSSIFFIIIAFHVINVCREEFVIIIVGKLNTIIISSQLDQ